jgi:hypothetical protein
MTTQDLKNLSEKLHQELSHAGATIADRPITREHCEAMLASAVSRAGSSK